jgi:hypothetical protein
LVSSFACREEIGFLPYLPYGPFERGGCFNLITIKKGKDSFRVFHGRAEKFARNADQVLKLRFKMTKMKCARSPPYLVDQEPKRFAI